MGRLARPLPPRILAISLGENAANLKLAGEVPISVKEATEEAERNYNEMIQLVEQILLLGKLKDLN